MEKDYWIYQDRQNDDSQWSIHFIKAWKVGHPETIELSFTVYSDAIKEKTKSISRWDVHHERITEYVADVIDVINTFSLCKIEDMNQLETAITRIISY